jgi:hypothetical protein
MMTGAGAVKGCKLFALKGLGPQCQRSPVEVSCLRPCCARRVRDFPDRRDVSAHLSFLSIDPLRAHNKKGTPKRPFLIIAVELLQAATL